MTRESSNWLKGRQRVFSTLIGLALWAGHLGKAERNQDGSTFGMMSVPFEFFLKYGQWAALALMACGLTYFVIRLRGQIRSLGYGPGAWLLLLNFYMSAKLLFYGNVDFFIAAVAVIGLSSACLVSAVASVEKNAVTLELGSVVAAALWIGGALIVLTNLSAVWLYPEAAVNDNLRMHGTSVNPQHLAMACALVSPAFSYVICKDGLLSVAGVLSAALFAGCIAIEYETGSRMGFASVVVGTIVYFRKYIWGTKFILGLILALTVGALMLLLFGEQVGQYVNFRFVEGREDTRSLNWIAAWDAFQQNPVFGVSPEQEVGRLIFVENFILAVASTGGVVGLLIAAFLLVRVLQVFAGVQTLVAWQRLEENAGSFYLSCIAVTLAVSVFEAALLGIIAAHTMIAYVVFAGASASISACRSSNGAISDRLS